MPFEDDYSQEPLPEESTSPGGFPPSAGLPPDAMAMMLGGAALPPMGGGQMGPGPGGDGQMRQDMGGGQGAPPSGPMGTGQGAGIPAAQAGMGDGRIPSGQMAMAGNPMGDPMMAVRQQFDAVTTELQLLASAYPMAAEELMGAGEAIARAMLKIAQGVQPNPAAPPMMA